MQPVLIPNMIAPKKFFSPTLIRKKDIKKVDRKKNKESKQIMKDLKRN